MTTFAAQQDSDRRLAELEALVRCAWVEYQEGLRGLEGHEYEDAEPAAWDQLQAALADVDDERAQLVTLSGSGGPPA